MRLFDILLANAPSSNQPAQPINRGFLLLLATFILLGAFLIGVLLLNLARRNRRKSEEARRATERAASGRDVDPWYEAGRRAKSDTQDGS